MSDQIRIRELFESALRDYERETGTELDHHPLTQLFAACNSAESVVAILQEQVQPVRGSRNGGRGDGGKIEKSLKDVVSVLYMLISSTALGREAIGLV